MLEKMLKLYESYHYEKQSLQLEMTHDKWYGWCLRIYHADSDTEIFYGEGSLNLLGAKGYVALEEWGQEYEDLENIEINLD